MKMISEFVLGFLKGSIDVDLKPFVENMPGTLGEEFGILTKKAWRGDEAPFRKWMSDNPKETVDLFVQIQQESESYNEDGIPSPLSYYMGALNLVVSVLKIRRVPIILKGFFHTSECLTCWDPRADQESLINNFSVSEDNNWIWFSVDNPRIFILKEKATESNMKNFNLRMRSENNPTLGYRLGLESKEISHIKEFDIGFETQKTIEIPKGSPGIATMIETLPIAIQIQDAFTEDVKNTFLKALENARENAMLKKLTSG